MDLGLRFALLGPVRVWRGEHELALGPAKQRAVLSVLLLHANRPVSVPRIIDAVWGDEPPADGANVVQKHIGGLRRILEPEQPARAAGRTVALTDAGYVIRVAPGGLDTDVLRTRVRAATEARDAGCGETAAAMLDEALAAWREPALSGLGGRYFDSARARLAAHRADAAELWAQVSLDLGRHERLVVELPDLVTEFPVRERLRAALVLALYRAGRQAEALQAYQDARRYLVEEYGVEPGDQLRDLHRRILRNDPGLLLHTGAVPPNGRPSAGAGGAAPVESAGPSPLLAARADHRGLGGPPGAGPPRPGWWAMVGGLLAAVLSLASFGLVTWAVMGVYAASRRSRWLAVAAVGYGVLAMVWLVIIPVADVAYFQLRMAVGVAAMLVAMVGGAFHIGYLAVRPFRRPAMPAPHPGVAAEPRPQAVPGQPDGPWSSRSAGVARD